MKVTLKRSSFLQELQTVQRAISSKTTIPILTGVKIVLTNESLHLTGSNADISIETTLSATDEKAQMDIDSTGAVVLQARFFIEIVRRLPEDFLTFELTDAGQVKISSGKAEFVVNALSADDYPHLPTIDAANQLQIEASTLTQLVNETVFSVSQHESRPILTGVHFILKNGVLTAVATDSHRLSQRRLSVDSPIDFNMVIPGKSLLELSRSLVDENEIVEMSIMDNQVVFKTEKMDFYSRLLEGNYPDTARLIPTTFNTEATFNGTELVQAVERASLLSHEGRNNIVKLNIDNEKIILSGNSPEVGYVEEELNYKTVTGDPLIISFNPDYMKDALRAFGEQDILVCFVAPVRPFTLTPVDESIDFTQLITPVRTN